jgi:iron complex outermembrane recepter protein
MISDKNSAFGGIKAVIGAGVALLPLIYGASPAFAQAADTEVNNQEIIVTAQRREQSLIDVPAAITAIGGETVKTLNVTSMPAIAQQVPSFTITYERGKNTTPTFNLRGIQGDGLASRLNESSIAIYADDVYLGDENMLNGAVFDLRRVEVLRGPQGTLFGRNATGGLVNFISEAPTREFSGYANALYGSDNATTLEGAVSGPISDSIRARVAGSWDRHNGHYRNVYQGAGANGVPKKIGARDVWGVRGTFDADLGPETLLRIIGLHTESDSETTPVYIYGTLKPGTTSTGPYTRADMCSLGQILDAQCIANVQVRGGARQTESGAGLSSSDLTSDQLRANGKTTGITARLTHDFDIMTFTAIANYTKNRFFEGLEAGQVSPGLVSTDFLANVGRFNKARQFSQELRLNGSTSVFDWVIGGLYYNDKKYNNTLISAPVASIAFTTTAAVKSHSFALFGQLDNRITDQLTLAVGGRYTIDIRELTEASTFNAATAATTTASFQDILAYMKANGRPTRTNTKDFTGKIGLTWKPDDDASYYLSFSRGIKGAGFNGGFSPTSTIAVNAVTAGPVPQEVLDSLELGAKNRFFGRTLMVNSALFYYNYQGKQVAVANYDPLTRTSAFNYISAGTARVYGAETEITFRPSTSFDITASGSLIRTKITKSGIITPDSFGALIPLKGKQLVSTPRYTFNVVPAYHLPIEGVGRFTLQSEINGVARRNFSITNDPLAGDKPHIFVNLRVMWESPDGRYNAQAFVTNVFNEAQALNGIDTVIGRNGTYVISNNEGRLWGAKLGVRF